MFHYPATTPYFVGPFDPYAYHHQPYYPAGPSRFSQAQRQRELYHEQRRRALALEAQRRERQSLAYEQQLKEQDWARRMGYSPFWGSRRKEHDVNHEDEHEHDSQETEPEQEQEQEESSLRQAHVPKASISKASTSSTRSGVSIPITESTSYGQAEQEAAATLQKHFRARLYRRQALASLKTIADTFTQRSTVKLPTTLHTADNGKLAYDSHNAPFHAYEDALVKMLTQLDEVSTKGDDKIKMARKALVRKIEKELSRLDQIKELSLTQLSSSTGSSEPEDSGVKDADSDGEEPGEEDEEEWHGIPSDTEFEGESESAGDIEPLV
ncbi:BQ2448_6495 [Microbotryum intermedium]|uniref:BQ2448_6495 protein n=1 Tax=Microbotryum intermedium TaxID=269621 RepID=A0A238FPY1_9BASI|nr:BQ2448_6495 [Microbotryum intermedium]